jgi:hypothetical protein
MAEIEEYLPRKGVTLRSNPSTTKKKEFDYNGSYTGAFIQTSLFILQLLQDHRHLHSPTQKARFIC